MPSGSELDGKIAWIGERRPELVEEAKEPIRRGETVIRKLEEKKPGSNVLHEKKRRRAILPTKLDALLTEEKSRAGPSLFGLPPPLPVKSFPWKKTRTPVTRTGRGIGRLSGAAYRLRLPLVKGWGSPSQYLVLEVVRFRLRPGGDPPGDHR